MITYGEEVVCEDTVIYEGVKGMTHLIYNNGAWRYYSIDGKEIINIAFYDRNGIVVQTERGWLETGDPAATHRTDVNR